MQISIKDLEFETIIGNLDFERITKQRVRINCTIEYQYEKRFLDYALITKHIEEQMINHEFELIEEAILSLKRSLKREFPLILSLFLKISKPDILANCEVSLSETFNY
ncbi:MAG: dihydroneopterin aldolase [Helicobacteraceae bacterium]|jgi:dihydroneopterin aldolase|nr:dihydroneopterin aldolase [Helicobacteraceae bacterium]